MFSVLLVILLHIFQLVKEFVDGPSDGWTVPSSLAWPTALWWTARLLVRFDSLQLPEESGSDGRPEHRRVATHSPGLLLWLTEPLGTAFLDSLAGFGRKLVPGGDGAGVGQYQRRTGSCGRLAAAADSQQTWEEPGAAYDQVCDFVAGGQGRRAGPESGELQPFVVS